MRRIRSHLTYANVMATIAVFVALGGGAYALDGRNSVDSGDIRKNAVKSSDIAKNAAKGRDVAEGTLVIGAKSLRRVRQRSATDADIPPGGTGIAKVQCNQGEQFLSGGSDYSGTDVSITASRFEPPNGWAVFLDNEAASGNANLTAHVYCLAR